jgi:outer membrane lipase/esterase
MFLKQPSRARLRTGLITLLAACAVLACGGGTSTVSILVPTRFVAFGDGTADLGQVGGTVYTVKDGSTGYSFVQQLAASYGKSITAQSAGGQSWARGNARIALKPDAAGNAATLTMAEQIDAFLAANTVGQDDVIVLSAGISDMVVQGDALAAGTITADQAIANIEAAGKAMGAQAKRIVAAGGKHVVVAGAYDVGKSPYATARGITGTLQAATLKFNEALLVSLVNDGNNVLFVDFANRANLIIASPASYSFVNATTPACTTPTADTCTPSTVAAGVTYDTYLFADDRYFTPAGNRALGALAYERVKARW